MQTLDLDKPREILLESSGNLLVLGGPGSGKTTISLLKAEKEIQNKVLLSGQKILFLSFARATIGRVAQHAQAMLSTNEASVLEINTYHGFAWGLLRSHGYLLRGSGPIALLAPHEAAAKLSGFKSIVAREAEMKRLFDEEGLLHFDLFAKISSSLLSKSRALCQLICNVYPLIILDEFQDTNEDEWNLVQALGRHSRLISLADVDQRIYEFRGADPQRISQFIGKFSPTSFDFGNSNHRSNGTDIAIFGNDLLSGANKSKAYQDVQVIRYGHYNGRHWLYPLKTQVIAAIKRCNGRLGRDWSLTVLVPSKKLMVMVSDYLSSDLDALPRIGHEVALDTSGPSLAASIIAGLLEGGSTEIEVRRRLLALMSVYLKGRKGDDQPTQADMQLVEALDDYAVQGRIGSKKKKYLQKVEQLAKDRMNISLSGNVEQDWLLIRSQFEHSGIDVFIDLASDAKYLRLLHKGALLRSRLGELWRTNSNYVGAERAVRDALIQEHFTAAVKSWKGLHVMTIHKSKGKEFSEVIVYEAKHIGQYVRHGATERDAAQALLALRVGITRAMKRATVMTPRQDPCKFF